MLMNGLELEREYAAWRVKITRRYLYESEPRIDRSGVRRPVRGLELEQEGIRPTL